MHEPPAWRRSGLGLAGCLVLALMTAGCGQGNAGVAATVSSAGGEFELSQDTVVPVEIQSALADGRRNAIVLASERVAPAVVSVNTTRRESVRPRSMFEQMMQPRSSEREVAGLGSGFIVTPDGLVSPMSMWSAPPTKSSSPWRTGASSRRSWSARTRSTTSPCYASAAIRMMNHCRSRRSAPPKN